MSIRTRFEIETFLLGAHPTKSRQAQQLVAELEQAKATSHPDLVVLQEVFNDFAAENDIDALLADIETSEEEYWVQRLSRLAAIDILTIGKVQPEHMNYMASLSDDSFAACVKNAATLAKTLNDQVREIEAELSDSLASD
jgi:predicted amidohydrolase